MKEIQFKARMIGLNKWIRGTYLKYGRDGAKKHYIVPHYAIVLYNVEVAPETLGQYIGQTDKNGEMIFEGDILQNGNKRIVIEDIRKPSRADLSKYEIVGNIHDL